MKGSSFAHRRSEAMPYLGPSPSSRLGWQPSNCRKTSASSVKLEARLLHSTNAFHHCEEDKQPLLIALASPRAQARQHFDCIHCPVCLSHGKQASVTQHDSQKHSGGYRAYLGPSGNPDDIRQPLEGPIFRLVTPLRGALPSPRFLHPRLEREHPAANPEAPHDCRVRD
eukprot:3780992-Rhodomonas_salina.4